MEIIRFDFYPLCTLKRSTGALAIYSYFCLLHTCYSEAGADIR